ncbi:MAG TPA: hypothetical protein VJS12_11930 [Steroidobacteraceae bacterium]|nr:hypothetical protein [Steroidobacteraceae bacterium]
MKASLLAGFTVVLSCGAGFAAAPPVYWDVDANGCKFASTAPVDTTQPTFVFTGKCVDGLVSGPGEVMLLDGSRTLWIGDFQQGRLVKGASESADGTYQGEFRDNTAHGHGTITFIDGSTFKGRFENGAPAGNTGEITIPGAGRYAGGLNMRGLVPNGRGIMYYTNGSILVGEFKDGMEAVGTLKLADGTVAQGTFRNNQFAGGKVSAADGRQFEVDLRTGAVVELLKDGTKQSLDALPENIPL